MCRVEADRNTCLHLLLAAPWLPQLGGLFACRQVTVSHRVLDGCRELLLPPGKKGLAALEALRVGITGRALMGSGRLYNDRGHLDQVKGALPVFQGLHQVQDLEKKRETEHPAFTILKLKMKAIRM